MPLSYRPDLEDVLREHGVTCQELSSQRTDNTAHLPQKTRNPSMWKAMAGQIARDSAVGSIVAVATSLVGMAACTVM